MQPKLRLAFEPPAHSKSILKSKSKNTIKHHNTEKTAFQKANADEKRRYDETVSWATNGLSLFGSPRRHFSHAAAHELRLDSFAILELFWKDFLVQNGLCF